MLTMYTVKDFTRVFNVKSNTIRYWTSEFAAYLSNGANPEKGKARKYSEKDGRVIALIGDMRTDNEPYEKIHASLAAGDLGEWPRMSPGADNSTSTKQNDTREPTELVTRLTAAVSRFEGQLDAVTNERDYLRDKLEEEKDARLDAEKRAASAEAITLDMDRIKKAHVDAEMRALKHEAMTNSLSMQVKKYRDSAAKRKEEEDKKFKWFWKK